MQALLLCATVTKPCLNSVTVVVMPVDRWYFDSACDDIESIACRNRLSSDHLEKNPKVDSSSTATLIHREIVMR